MELENLEHTVETSSRSSCSAKGAQFYAQLNSRVEPTKLSNSASMQFSSSSASELTNATFISNSIEVRVIIIKKKKIAKICCNVNLFDVERVTKILEERVKILVN